MTPAPDMLRVFDEGRGGGRAGLGRGAAGPRQPRSDRRDSGEVLPAYDPTFGPFKYAT